MSETMALTTVAPADLLVQGFMTRDVIALDRNQPLDDVDDLIALKHVRHFPVVDEGRVIGVVSERDLLRSVLAQALGYGTKARRTLMHTLRVKDIMSEPATTIASATTAREAARLMIERHVGCLPVVERGLLVGLVTESDLLRQSYGL